jgi:hypothetical protein
VKFPEVKRGPRTAAGQAAIDRFVEWLLSFRSTLDFTPQARGWCYLLENLHVVSKDAFKRLEYFINERRKDGSLPLDFCAEDEKRAAQNREDLDKESPKEYAELHAKIAAECWEFYDPINFWEYQQYYIEMAVEKVDLRELFEKVCAEYHLPIWNCGGWSDINSRAEVMKRFRDHDRAGRHCVLLYCGDLDPKGEQMSDYLRSNLQDLEHAVGWSPDESRLTIERFGLNEDFIRKHGLTWIDGLVTSSGEDLANTRHPDHTKAYVQNYIKKYGERKVEANALVAQYQAGRQLCRETIEKYIDPDGIKRYEKARARRRREVKKELPAALKAELDSKSGGNGKAR